MKRSLLLSSFALLSAIGASAQTTLFSENFDGTTGTAIPSTWTQTNVGWKSGTISTLHTDYLPFTGNNTRFLAVEDYPTNQSYSAEGLISPSIDLTNATSTAFLKFNSGFLGYHTTSTNIYETFKVYYSTDNGSNWVLLGNISGNTASYWEYKYFSVASLAGQSAVKFKFLYSDGGSSLVGTGIDDISVANMVHNDLSLTSIDQKSNNDASYGLVGTSKPLSGKVFNNGADTIHSFTVNMQIGTGTVQSNTISSVSIAPFTSYSFSVPNAYTISSVGNFTGNVWVGLTNDVNASNDSSTVFYAGISSYPTKKIVFEEATGIWCGFCPRGAVGMDKFATNHPGIATQIAVHNNDVLTYSAYDSYIGNYISGYPSIVVDRKYTGDPGDIETLYDSLGSAFGYAAIGIDTTLTTGTTVKVPISITPSAQLDSVKLALVVTESNITSDSTKPTSWYQHNYYSGGNYGALDGWETKPEYVAYTRYHFVARTAVPSPEGAVGNLPYTLTVGNTYHDTLSVTLNSSWNAANLNYSVLLIGSDGRILNSASTALPTLLPVLYNPNATGTSNIAAGINSLKVYPNPVTNNSFTLELNNDKALSASVTITDISGKTVYKTDSKQLASGVSTLKLSTDGFANGIYFVNLNTEKGNASVKIVVNK